MSTATRPAGYQRAPQPETTLDGANEPIPAELVAAARRLVLRELDGADDLDMVLDMLGLDAA